MVHFINIVKYNVSSYEGIAGNQPSDYILGLYWDNGARENTFSHVNYGPLWLVTEQNMQLPQPMLGRTPLRQWTPSSEIKVRPLILSATEAAHL